MLSATAAIGLLTCLYKLLPLKPDNPAAVRLAHARTLFLAKAQPLARIDLEPQLAILELVDPTTTRPFLHRWPRPAAIALRGLAQTCRSNPASDYSPRALVQQKAFIWAHFLCRDRTDLPPDFFEQPPFMHPSGLSYAALALASGRAEFAEPTWTSQHMQEFHLHEYGRPDVQRLLPAPLTFIAKLDRLALLALARRQADIVGGGLIWLREAPISAADIGSRYAVYAAETWKNFGPTADFELQRQDANSNCAVSNDFYCWSDASRDRSRRQAVLASALAAFAAALAAILAAFLYKKIRQQRRQREQQMFQLRALTHELRTPATSIALSLEALRDDFDRLTESGQDAFLRLSCDVQRLQRVIVGSSRYLKAHATQRERRFEFTEFDLGTWLVAKFDACEHVHCEALSPDLRINCDPYWLNVCLENLIDNALRHGHPPVLVQCERSGPNIIIQVRDHGSTPVTSLEELTAAAQHHANSGLKLGLGLVQQIMRGLDGELQFSPTPTTTFRMIFRKVP